jgi:hypothetical protein
MNAIWLFSLFMLTRLRINNNNNSAGGGGFSDASR